MIFADYTLDRSTPIPLYYQLKGFILQAVNELEQQDCHTLY